MRRQGSHRRGFTLVEMMVVLGVTGILVGLAVASSSTISSTAKVNGEGEALTNLVRVAALRTIALGCPHVVRYRGPLSGGAQSGQAVMYRRANCAALTPGTLFQQASDPQVNNYQVSTANIVNAGGIDFRDSGFYVGFLPDGTVVTGQDNSASSPTASTSLTFNNISVRNMTAGTNQTYTRNVVFRGASNVSFQ